ncbi:hypothetical protein SAMN04487830_11545 [Pseudobutyrivibrio sp. OR37]|uniref:hypothetical protein n=1 Tax=Pseudobutyrivibrio sp. OR37 TaxID=1798186 RepID=UPI0008EE64D6|nr:hypothetical protein [Pseudobutyrivibrio sp. OR37]SFH97877.1 hypothetical protein SAMN04487830_11545 [Pseudobutyrivibrio sp. OR37]
MKYIAKNPLVILAVGLLIVLGSSVGATRAAFQYQSEANEVDFRTSEVKVAVLEGTDDKNNNDMKDVSKNAVLSFPGVPTDDVKIGKKYPEVVSVKNTSSKYNEYVRVIVKKYWVKEGKDGQLVKDTSLDPSLIKLAIDDKNAKWIVDKSAHTDEQEIYYLAAPLKVGETASLVRGVTISNKVVTAVKTNTAKDEKGKEILGTIEDTYIYDGGSFYVDVKVDAIQTHNAKDAIMGAWGVEANIQPQDEGNIISINEVSSTN